jgi:hypothetical protein
MISTRVILAGLIGATLLHAGCRTLPDTQPFTDATISLRAAVSTGGKSTVSELRRLKFADTEKDRMLREKVRDFETQWKARDNLMKAMSDYATSLQEIASAGKQGEESVRKLTGATQVFLGAVGAAGLTGPAAVLVGDVVNYGGGMVLRAQAAKSLEASLADLQPVIDRVAELLVADAADLKEIATACFDQQVYMLDERDATELAVWSSLQDQKDAVLKSLRPKLEAGNFTSDAGARLAQLEELEAGLRPWRTGYENERRGIRERHRLTDAMLEEVQTAFPTWAATHGKLLTAVRTKRIPSTTELTDAARRIHELVDRYRKL